LPVIVARCTLWSTTTDAIDGSRTSAVSGLIAEPTCTSSDDPTGTNATAGATVIGGCVPVGDGAGEGEAEAEGVGLGVGLGVGAAA
jgi:hypothetical protein